jgi:hypothetical protein
MLFESLPGALQVLLEGLFRSTWSLLGASWEQLGTSWGPFEHNLALWGASWVQFGASWVPFGRLLGSTWSSWTPPVLNFGSSQRHLNSTCFPTGLQRNLDCTWAFNWSPSAIRSPLGDLWRALGGRKGSNHKQRFICTAQRAAKCNSCSWSTKTPVAGWRQYATLVIYKRLATFSVKIDLPLFGELGQTSQDLCSI